MQVIINNILTNYRKQGRGPVVLFLHGWGDDSRTFAPLTSILSSNYTCITLDLPGTGSSHAPESAWGVEDYARFTADFINKIKIAPDALLGHSNGGTIALFALSHHLVGIDKLVLLASAGIRNEENLKKGAYKVVAKTGKQFTRFLPKHVQQKLRRKLYSSAGSDILVAPDLEETFKKVVGYDVEADARKVTQPTLLIYAADDEATPTRYGEKLHSAIKDSQLEILPDGGHFLHQTHAEAVARLIEGFLK